MDYQPHQILDLIFRFFSIISVVICLPSSQFSWVHCLVYEMSENEERAPKEQNGKCLVLSTAYKYSVYDLRGP